ncbi:MAG: hypothetical protein H7A25_10515 [Leptospiraceae bacterium]|nr:hypothetical protein [Leptospiraceae bacterium]
MKIILKLLLLFFIYVSVWSSEVEKYNFYDDGFYHRQLAESDAQQNQEGLKYPSEESSYDKYTLTQTEDGKYQNKDGNIVLKKLSSAKIVFNAVSLESDERVLPPISLVNTKKEGNEIKELYIYKNFLSVICNGYCKLKSIKLYLVDNKGFNYELSIRKNRSNRS